MLLRDQLEERGRLLWQELHEYAWLYPGEATAEVQREAGEWLAWWAARVPSFGCSCRREWERILRICVPPLDQGDGFYWWTVAAHDRVNRRLGKVLAAPAWSLQHPLLLAG